jgi:hypothetical protein
VHALDPRRGQSHVLDLANSIRIRDRDELRDSKKKWQAFEPAS